MSAKTLAKQSWPEPIFPWPEKAVKILGVKISGQDVPANQIEPSADGKVVKLLGLNPTQGLDVVITYSP